MSSFRLTLPADSLALEPRIESAADEQGAAPSPPKYHRYGEEQRRLRVAIGRIIWIVTLFCATAYLSWAAAYLNWDIWYVAIPFFLAELGWGLMLLMWGFTLWDVREHAPKAPTAKQAHTVDVFIPTCGEAIDVVERTVGAAVKLDWPHKVISILDDKQSDEVRDLAARYNVQYFRRTEHHDRKAGNLNYALERTSGDIVLVIDADQIAQPDFISSTVGYFDLPYVGFVSTMQKFRLPSGDPWGNEDPVFYRALQIGKDHANAGISCGSGVFYRRKALKEIGGFSTWNVVEDLHTSYRLHQKGWRSVYHNTAFTEGDAPIDVNHQTRQRWQWAVDSLRMIFWDNPLKKKSLTWRQRLDYWHFGSFYLVAGICLPIFFILPIWSLLSHTFVVAAPVTVYLMMRLPYLFMHLLSNKVLSAGSYSLKAFQMQAGLFNVYLQAIWVALRSKNTIPPYKVTGLGSTTLAFHERLRKVTPHLLIIIASLAAIAVGFATIKDDKWLLWVNVFWAAWVVVILSRFTLTSLMFGRPTKARRYQLQSNSDTANDHHVTGHATQ